MTEGVATCSLADGADVLRTRIAEAATGAVALARPSTDALPYRGLVAALLERQGFRLDLRGKSPAEALALVCDRLLGSDAFGTERAALAADIEALERCMQTLAGGPRPQVSLRTFFAPGDLVWHLDRVNEPRAYRLVWPIGRPAGMRVTTPDNIEAGVYRAFMRREHALLCQLDTRVAHRGEDPEKLWAHRPAQLAAMRTGHFPFLRDPARQWAIAGGHASIHCVDTPCQQGTYHRSDWANRARPGLQIVVTAVSA